MVKLLCTAAIGLALSAAAAPAEASIIISLVGNPTAATVIGQSGFDYTYSATLSSDEELDKSVNPVFFTVYDFGAATLVTTNMPLPSIDRSVLELVCWVPPCWFTSWLVRAVTPPAL